MVTVKNCSGIWVISEAIAVRRSINSFFCSAVSLPLSMDMYGMAYRSVAMNIVQSFGLLSVSWRALRPNIIDAAEAEATHDIGARELKASKHDRINTIIAIAANRYCIIR